MEYLIIPFIGIVVYKNSRKSLKLKSLIDSKLQVFKKHSPLRELNYDLNEFKINNLCKNTDYYDTVISKIKSDQSNLETIENKVKRVLDFEKIAYDISLIKSETDESIGGNSTCELDYNLLHGSCK